MKDKGQSIQELEHENKMLMVKLEFYQNFMDSSGYWETFRDKAGKIIYISPNFAQMLGNNKKDYLKNSKKLIEFVHPDDQATVIENYYKVLKQKKVEKQVCRVIKPDTSLSYISIDYKHVYDKLQNFIGFRTCIADVTEQTKAEKRLKLNQKHMQMIFDTMTEGVALNKIIFDENNEMVDYRILKVNKAYYNIADYNNVEVIGNVATVLYGMPVEIIKKFWHEHKNRDTVFYTEMVSPLNNKTFLIASSPFYDNIFVTTFFDITERIKTEKELNHYKENLEKIIKERTAELKDKNEELEHFNRLFVNREFRIKELKDKIIDLKLKLSSV